MSQESTKIAFQGYAGAYSDLACRSAYPEREPLPCNSFEDAFQAVQTGEAELAMIPVDNTLAGRVADVHHLLPEGGLYIIGEHFQLIRHALLGVQGTKISELKHVHSHVHAIPQCREMLRRLQLQAHVHVDTAGAAEEIAQRGDRAHAAIASSLAAKIYGLDVLEEDVQDADHNTTRFLILSREELIPAYTEDEVFLTSLIFRIRHIPAALYKALGGFATNGLNMTKLESYIIPGFKNSQFYCEIEGHPDCRPLQLALEELNFFAEEVRRMGVYPTHPFRGE